MENPQRIEGTEKIVLIVSIFIAGLCSIIYELLISTTSSYFLGDSIKQFSITIGVYMAAMGVGSFLSRLFKGDLLLQFIGVEIVLGLIGGSSVPILYFIFANSDYWGFMSVMILLIVLIGILTGLEIPLLARIMKEYYPLKINLSNVLSLDYMGALLATLLFPFFLLPWLGTFKSSLIFGIINLLIGFLNLWYFSPWLNVSKKRILSLASFTVLAYFGLMLFFAQSLLSYWNDSLYKDDIIYYEESPYQHIVLTKGGEDVRLYLNRVIQFSSMDEYRYHESLVHIPMSFAPYKGSVLLLGGGEGLAVREILKHKDVKEIYVIDLDPSILDLAVNNPHVKKINQGAMLDPKVIAIPQDAFVFLREKTMLFDVIISDLPDPTNESLARLYSREFFKLAKKRLSPNGIFVTQATSPNLATNAFWCINSSIKAADLNTYPYQAYVPSFGGWGFIIASNNELDINDISIDVPTEFLDNKTSKSLFEFEKDIILDSIPASTLDKPHVLELYLKDWNKWSKESMK